MNVTHEREASDSRPYDIPKQRRPGSKSAPTSLGTILSFVLLLGLAACLGYFTFTLYRERGVLRDQLAASHKDVTKLRSHQQTRERALSKLGQQHKEESELLAQTKAELAATQARLDELNAEHGEIEEQLAEFKQMTAQLKRMIDSGRLQVTFRKGRMIVELPAQVLFPSGSADLTEEGREALTTVAKTLRGLKSRHFIVAGHTDNVPVSGRFASNWELSSARAVTVTSELIRGGLKPEQLVAAGYSEYDPVARNTSDDGRQKNRRIEIILEPRLRPIPELNVKGNAAPPSATKRTK